MEIFLHGETWIAILTLTFLEIVLGVDNIIFISIVSNKLPKDKQETARRIGLVMALIIRIVMLVSLVWVIHHLTKPLFYLFDNGFSVREIILFSGGLFLLAKSVSEVHHKMDDLHENPGENKSNKMFRIILQIIVLDVVFSFDSILTAIGLTEEIIIMIIAVTISLFIMLMFAGKISHFIAKNPTLEILALSFLILIGFMLILEGFHIEIPKGYIYFAVFFSLMVETINIRIRKRRKLAAK